MNRLEVLGYEAHPIAAYDPYGARDIVAWKRDHLLYTEWIIDNIVHSDNRSQASRFLARYSDTLQKIFKFERATRTTLISYVDSSGRMRQNRSIIKDLMVA